MSDLVGANQKKVRFFIIMERNKLILQNIIGIEYFALSINVRA